MRPGKKTHRESGERLMLMARGLWIWHMAATSHCHHVPRKGVTRYASIKCKKAVQIFVTSR
jgi:hypothetical protein